MRMGIRAVVSAVAVVLGHADFVPVAADLLYVSLDSNKIVTYDVSLGSSIAVNFSATDFATSNLNAPRGLAFDNFGNLYVANTGANNITKYNSSGTYQSTITSQNIVTPIGLASDPLGGLYVANTSINSVSVFNSETFNVSLTGYFENPVDLAIHPQGYLAVSNTVANGSVVIIESNGGLLGGLTGLNTPRGLAFDNTYNYLFVGIVGNNTIAKYDLQGALVQTISASAGIIDSPVGITFDNSGNLYVANAGNSTIAKFDSSGQYQFSWETAVTPRFLAIPVPEPSTYALGAIASGVMACIAGRRKARRA